MVIVGITLAFSLFEYLGICLAIPSRLFPILSALGITAIAPACAVDESEDQRTLSRQAYGFIASILPFDFTQSNGCVASVYFVNNQKKSIRYVICGSGNQTESISDTSILSSDLAIGVYMYKSFAALVGYTGFSEYFVHVYSIAYVALVPGLPLHFPIWKFGIYLIF